jgi:hypothetical protein
MLNNPLINPPINRLIGPGNNLQSYAVFANYPDGRAFGNIQVSLGLPGRAPKRDLAPLRGRDIGLDRGFMIDKFIQKFIGSFSAGLNAVNVSLEKFS